MKKIVNLILSTAIVVQCIFPTMLVQGKERKETCNDCVVSIDYSTFDKNIKEDELMLTVKKTLLNANKYALGGWFKERKHLDSDTGKYYNLYKASSNSATPEYIYRFPAAQAFGLAISLKTGAFDETVIEVSPKEAKEKAIKMAVSVAHEHKANTGIGTEPQYKVWGDDWQAAHWAYYAGYAAWLLWDDLTPEEQMLIRNMLIHEANRFVNKNAVYWKTANGKEIYAGDSKIEEDSWNSELLNLAYHMMPQHENASKWEYRMIEYQLASFATPEMNESNEIIHGRKAKDWVKGYNINSDGTVINHDRVHPQYNAAATGVNTSIVNSIAGDSLPLAAKYNLDVLYSGLTKATFDSPPYRAPGGTMYIDDSAEVYYPEVSDWGYGVYDTFANIDVSAYAYGYNQDAYKWAKLHADKVLEQQSRYKDGHTYASGESLYPGNEEAITMRMGNSYMTLWLKEQVGVKFTNQVVDFPHEELPEIAENQQRIFASESGFVRDGKNGDTCYYPSDILEVKKDSPDYARESFLKFDIDELKSLPDKAEIYLPVIQVGDLVESKEIINKVELLQENNWTEDTLTYNNQPKSSGTVLAEWKPQKEGLKIDVSEYVKKAYSSDKKLSLKIYSTKLLGGNTFTNYGSTRQADPNVQPQMTVTYNTEKAELALAGSEKQDAFKDFNLNLEGYQFYNMNDYKIIVEYDMDTLELKNIVSGNQNLSIKSADKTYKGKVVVDVNDKVTEREKINIANLLFHPVGTGETSVKIQLVQNGKTLLRTEKQITVNKEDISGSLVSYKKADKMNISIADTTVRYGYGVSDHGTKKEVDIKTYGNTVNTRQAFFKFPLPTQEELDNIEATNLNFYVDRVGDKGTNVRFQYVDESWDEATLEWKNKPGVTAAVDGTAGTIPQADANTLFEQTISSAGNVTFDITDKLKELVAAGKTEITVFAYSTVEANKSIVIRTKEHEEAATRPFINTSFKKLNDIKINVDCQNTELDRFDTASFDITAKNISDIDHAVLDIQYSNNLQFQDIEKLDASIDVEVLGILNNMVRVKITKNDTAKAVDSTTNLFKVTFKAISKGNGEVNVIANDETGKRVSGSTTLNIRPSVDATVAMQLEGDTLVKVSEKAKLAAIFKQLIPGVQYQFKLEFDADYFALDKVYSRNQNISIQQIQSDEHAAFYNLVVLPSDKEYIMDYTYSVLKDYDGKQNIDVALLDDDKKIEQTHVYSYDKTTLPSVDKTELEKMYNVYKNIKKGNYTDASWADFQNALDQTKKLLNRDDITQDDVTKALHSLKDAFTALSEKPITPTTDKNYLKNQIESAKNLDLSVYTKETVEQFAIALTHAEAVYENNEAIQEDVDRASKLLEEAIHNLKYEDKKDAINELDRVDTGDTTNYSGFVVIALLGLGSFVLLFRKKRNNKRYN